ncbi:MAG: hypothetical protein ACK53L_14160, partial [Pirellulaceae bacterium]
MKKLEDAGKILGFNPKRQKIGDLDEIATKRLAKAHPDNFPLADAAVRAEEFRKINQAYQTLKEHYN